MTYRATGTEVLDCVVPNRTFVLDVDLDGLRLLARRPDGDRSVIVDRHALEVRLHRTLFADGTTTADWLAVDVDEMSEQKQAALRRALGVDLASYVLADGLPPPGEAIASSVVDAAATVELTAPSGPRRYRLVMDPERYAEGAEPGTVEAGDAPVIDVGIDGGSVSDVAVRPASADAATAAGWRIAFSRLRRPLPERTGTAVDVSDETARSLTAAPITGCSLGGRPDAHP